MEQLHPADKEYQNFITWFKENHPELHEKYERNIDFPIKTGGGVTINNSFRISEEEVVLLNKIVKSYYSSHLNP